MFLLAKTWTDDYMGTHQFTHDIRLTDDPVVVLEDIVQQYQGKKCFIVVDANTKAHCLPILHSSEKLASFKTVEISQGEDNKSLETVQKIWNFLEDEGADRKSLLISLGGGLMSDLCGFAASCFKRGIDFVNIPTTLLSQVDASVGGKTGINFNGLKNEIGLFSQPKTVIISSVFLRSIDHDNFISGYAEMLKHGMICSKNHWDDLQSFDFKQIDYPKLTSLVGDSVAIKDEVVTKDPTEQNIRKSLNFGHTAGHAFESFALHEGREMLHGFAVAYGIVVELYLSSLVLGFPMSLVNEISRWIIDTYGEFTINEGVYNELYQYMTKDKKNESGRINFTLIPNIGTFEINKNCTKAQITEALQYFQSL